MMPVDSTDSRNDNNDGVSFVQQQQEEEFVIFRKLLHRRHVRKEQKRKQGEREQGQEEQQSQRQNDRNLEHAILSPPSFPSTSNSTRLTMLPGKREMVDSSTSEFSPSSSSPMLLLPSVQFSPVRRRPTKRLCC